MKKEYNKLYIDYLFSIFKKANGLKDDVRYDDYWVEFRDFLIKYEDVSNMYAKYLEYLKINGYEGPIMEYGAGKSDTVATTLIDDHYPVVVVSEKYASTFEGSGIQAYNGKIICDKDDVRIRYDRDNVNRINVDDFCSVVCHSPIELIGLNAIYLLLTLSSKGKDISIGRYGYITDKNWPQVINEMKELRKKIDFINRDTEVIYNEDFMGDYYFTNIMVKGRVRRHW